jgi:hypothetical protein
VLRRHLCRAGCLLLGLSPTLSCDGGLRLIVVEQGGSNGSSVAGTMDAGATGGSVAVIPSAGSGGVISEGGRAEPALAGAAGAPEESAGGAGGMPDVPVWDAPPRYTASFVSHAHPGQYIRYVADEGFIGAIDVASTLEKQQASFEMIPGMAKASCSSFRAVETAGLFFRHSGSRIYLNAANDQPLFLYDATFCEEAGMADPAGVTFRSSNYPERVIHLRNQNELWIDDVPAAPIAPEFASDATFYRETAWSERGSP